MWLESKSVNLKSAPNRVRAVAAKQLLDWLRHLAPM
jgi:hypothetical protein